MRKTTVLLADDHQIFLAGLQRLLEDEFDVVGAVGDGREMREAALRLNPDVIVADISMPSLNGIDAVRSLQADGCKSKVIFLSMHGDALYRSEALKAGGSRYILKRDAPDKLVAAIHGTAEGESMETALSDAGDAQEGGEAKGITPRQREIWQLLAEGQIGRAHV